MSQAWPEMPKENWQQNGATLHMWSQIVGKTRMALAPFQNHWWQVTFYVTPTGLTTSVMEKGPLAIEVEFDFVGHALRARDARGRTASFPLEPMTVAEFYRRYREALRSLDLEVKIFPRPVEVQEAIRFAEDEVHRSYDPRWSVWLHQVLLLSDAVLKEFRGRFLGKSSPVHFFWGGFDLAATRFSGRTAPRHGGGVPNCADWVMWEAYSHEVSSAGFWPGAAVFPEPIFYSYAYPAPEGFAAARVRPAAARWEPTLGEFILPYDALRRAADPAADLRAFLESTYEAAATLAKWDRAALERAT
jgi:hypothetical protein